MMTPEKINELIEAAERSLDNRETDLDVFEREIGSLRDQLRTRERWAALAKTDIRELREQLEILRLAQETAIRN